MELTMRKLLKQRIVAGTQRNGVLSMRKGYGE